MLLLCFCKHQLSVREICSFLSSRVRVSNCSELLLSSNAGTVWRGKQNPTVLRHNRV